MLYTMQEEEVRVATGIDTLYFYEKTELENYIQNFSELEAEIANGADTFREMQFLGKTGGFYYFRLFDDGIEIANVGFKSPFLQLQVNNCLIQLNGQAIYHYGVFNAVHVVENLLVQKGFRFVSNHVSRVDMNIFCNVSFANLDLRYTALSSRSESDISSFRGGDLELQTIYFGKRQSGKVLRIYDKMAEMKKSEKDVKNTLIVNILLENDVIHDLDSTLWNVELELHRKFLKKQYAIDTVADLERHANSIFEQEIARYRILEKEEKYDVYLQNDKNKIPTLPLWQKITMQYNVTTLTQHIEKQKQPRYKMTKNALLKRTFENLARYNHYNQDSKLSIEEYITLIISATQDREAHEQFLDDDTRKYVDLEIFDSDGFLRKITKHMRADYARLENQDYSHYFEALKA